MKKSSSSVEIQLPHIASVKIGGELERREFAVIAGPCSIESRDQFRNAALSVKAAGATVLRGGIFKMRTNPNAFQGLGTTSFALIKEVKNETQMPLCSEVMDPRQISDLMEVVDCFQVGSRNMYNYSLLLELGQTKKPVMLKRGLSATVEEWVLAAEYIMKGGGTDIIMCERGIRTFETITRNTLDLNAVAYLKAHTHFPVIVDPSHGTGRPELIAPMALAAAAAGADGIMIEVHPNPKEALSDGFQALTPQQFSDLMGPLQAVVEATGRKLSISRKPEISLSLP